MSFQYLVNGVIARAVAGIQAQWICMRLHGHCRNGFWRFSRGFMGAASSRGCTSGARCICGMFADMER
jgi:hypothetical protein